MEIKKKALEKNPNLIFYLFVNNSRQVYILGSDLFLFFLFLLFLISFLNFYLSIYYGSVNRLVAHKLTELDGRAHIP